MTPLSTSRSEDSIMRATNGAAAITRYTMNAWLPSLLPTIALATGCVRISRMMNGIERRTLTITPTTELTALFGKRLPDVVPYSRTPSGMPMT